MGDGVFLLPSSLLGALTHEAVADRIQPSTNPNKKILVFIKFVSKHQPKQSSTPQEKYLSE